MPDVQVSNSEIAAMGAQITQLRVSTRSAYSVLSAQIASLTTTRDGLDQVGGLSPSETVTLATTLGTIITALTAAKTDLFPMLP